MHIVDRYDHKIRLISNGKPQNIIEFTNYSEFVGWVCKNYRNKEFFYTSVVNSFKGMFNDTISLSYRDFRRGTNRRLCGINASPPDVQSHHYYYIVKDEFGNKITKEEVEADLEKRIENRWRKYYEEKYRDVEFRKDPVPGTFRESDKHWWYYYYRHPRTTQERRWSFAYPEFIRPRRREHNLLSSWDDVPRGSSRNSKSWKRNSKKKHQWEK